MIIKLLLEFLALVVVFIIFRKALLALFPAGENPIELSEESKQMLRTYNKRYAWLFLGYSLVLTIVLFFLIRWFYWLLHASDENSLTWIIESTAIIAPAVVGGFLSASFLARITNVKLQKDGLFFFLEGVDDNLKGYDHNKLALWHVVVGVVVFGLLLVSQSQVYFKVRDAELMYSNMGFDKKEMALESIQKWEREEDYLLLITESDTISTAPYSAKNSELTGMLK